MKKKNLFVCFSLPLFFSFSCLVSLDGSIRSESDPAHHGVIVDGIGLDINVSGIPATRNNVTAKTKNEGRSIPVLEEGDVVSNSNILPNSPRGVQSGDFVVVVVKKDGTGYATGLVDFHLDSANNDQNLHSWVDSTNIPVPVGIASGGGIPDGEIYIGYPKSKLTSIGGNSYIVDEARGQIDTTNPLPAIVGKWATGPHFLLNLDIKGYYYDYIDADSTPFETGTWTWDDATKSIKFFGKVNLFYTDNQGTFGLSDFTNPILSDITIDSADSDRLDTKIIGTNGSIVGTGKYYPYPH